MALPVLTTAADVEKIVGYLKNKPAGATIEEAKAVLNKSVLDGRKIAAYLFWGLVARDGDRLKLTTRGWQLARNPGEAESVFRAILDGIPPYRSALEWIHHQEMETVTNV